MLEFIFTTILMICLGAVLYLMVRALPRVAEEPSDAASFLERWARSEVPEKVDAVLNGFLLKFLRKLKVVVLKLDNTLSNHLQKIKTEEEEKKASISFSDIAAPAGEEKAKPARRAEDRAQDGVRSDAPGGEKKE